MIKINPVNPFALLMSFKRQAANKLTIFLRRVVYDWRKTLMEAFSLFSILELGIKRFYLVSNFLLFKKKLYLCALFTISLMFSFSSVTFAQTCIHSNSIPLWYAGNNINDHYGSAAAACTAFDMASIGYPTHTFSRLEGQQQCVHINEFGNELTGVVNAGIKCIYDVSSNSGDSPNNTCNPINIATGNKYFREEEANNWFSLVRTYNHQSHEIGAWWFGYQQQLLFDEMIIAAQRPDNKIILFSKVNNYLFLAPSQRQERLHFDGTNYTLTLPNHVIETYDSTGRLISIEQPGALKKVLLHTPTRITITQGSKQLVLAKQGQKITQADFSDGFIINYSYNHRGLLASVSFPDGSARHYIYDENNYFVPLIGIEDENGNRISSVQYDGQNRAISSEKGPLNSGIERTQIQYNADGTRTLTNALGKKSTYYFTQFNGEYKMTQVEGHLSANCAGANKNYTYDTNGFMASKTDWKGNVTTYINNARGQELSRTEASGTPQARTITTEWHADYNLPIKITEPSRMTTMRYDSHGRLLSRNVTER